MKTEYRERKNLYNNNNNNNINNYIINYETSASAYFQDAPSFQ